jgi:hypothetical protein
MGLGLLQAGSGNIPGNPGAPIRIDPFPLLESREIIIGGVFRAGMETIAEGLDVAV